MKDIKEQKNNNNQQDASGFADSYLFGHKPIIPFIQEPPSGLLHFVVVVPAYLEDHVKATLISLKNTTKPLGNIEVIVLVNFSEDDSNENKEKSLDIFKDLEKWCRENNSEKIRFYPLFAPDLPSKHAGAGFARKIGMDQALNRFNRIGSSEGIIMSLDADSLVDPEYFTTVEEKIYNKNNYGGCILYFQHPIAGNKYSPEVYSAIIQYELHLRYYKHILKFTGFPYHQYTIGSCFGVKAGFYAAQGGMNRRKAGEDFYFLHKMFPHKSFADITSACVYPSPRPSMRVPFGTGATVTQLLKSKSEKYLTYSPEAFYELKQFLKLVPEFYSADRNSIEKEIDGLLGSITQMLSGIELMRKIDEIKVNTRSEENFNKRFFQWFDGFKVVKFLNFSHTATYKKIPVEEAVSQFLQELKSHVRPENAESMLMFFRDLDKKGEYLDLEEK